MVTRREIQSRRAEMIRSLRAECNNGRLRPGMRLPSVRELSETYGIGKNVVHSTLRDLVGEGLLHTVRGGGTFVGPPTPSSAAAQELYLLTTITQPIAGVPLKQELYEDRNVSLERGFSERIAARGGSTLTLDIDVLLNFEIRPNLPPIAGIYGGITADMRARLGLRDDIPVVGFHDHAGEPDRDDVISFADRDGGRMATEHLLSLGHERIAYLGLHNGAGTQSSWRWSWERQFGWEDALKSVGFSTRGLCFSSDEDLGDAPAISVAVARQIATRHLVPRPEITAVVACNDYAAVGIIEALREAAVPAARWPSIVGFDDLPLMGSRLLTSVRLPWDEAGRMAADLLWRRRHGELTGPPVHERIPFQLVRRLSSQTGWSSKMDVAALL